MKKAFLTGITGQDGYYLADYLLNKDYEVHGTVRRSSLINTHRIDPLISEYTKKGQLKLHYSDLIDSSSLSNLVNEIMPDEVYNLAAQSFVGVSFVEPFLTTEVTGIGDKKTAPDDINVINPAFDMTPPELISGIITEKGVATAPYEESIPKLFAAN